MRVKLKDVKHLVKDFSAEYDHKRIGREYYIDKYEMNHPVVMYCDDEDYGGFVTTRLQRRRRTEDNILELTTANSIYVLEILS